MEKGSGLSKVFLATVLVPSAASGHCAGPCEPSMVWHGMQNISTMINDWPLQATVTVAAHCHHCTFSCHRVSSAPWCHCKPLTTLCFCCEQATAWTQGSLGRGQTRTQHVRKGVPAQRNLSCSYRLPATALQHGSCPRRPDLQGFLHPGCPEGRMPPCSEAMCTV